MTHVDLIEKLLKYASCWLASGLIMLIEGVRYTPAERDRAKATI